MNFYISDLHFSSQKSINFETPKSSISILPTVSKLFPINSILTG